MRENGRELVTPTSTGRGRGTIMSAPGGVNAEYKPI